MRLSDAITQALTQGQRVRYATVVGNTITGTQVSIGGEVVEVPYLGDDAPEVGKRAVLVASAGGLLCIGTTTPEEPEWQEPEAMVVRPEGGWHATRKYPWQGGEWRASTYSTTYSNITTGGLWAGIRRQDEFQGTTYFGPILDSEMAFALQYPVLPIPDGAELLDATLRLYSTYYYSVGTSGGEPFARRVPTKSRTVEVVMEAGALTPSADLPAHTDPDPFPTDENFAPVEVGLLTVQQGVTIRLPFEWTEAMAAGDLRTLVLTAQGGLWHCNNLQGDAIRDPSFANGFRINRNSTDNFDLTVTYRRPVDPDAP